jgi:GNAT superfamily N-acetyltransferase
MLFKHFTDDDYEPVCDFLKELNARDTSHINWNWARFEWMYEHPEFDKSSLGTIGLWLDCDKIVGAAIYDMYFGEGFCGVLPEYKDLYPEVLDYACRELRDDSGFALAVCDENVDEINTVLAHEFVMIDQTENIMELDLDREFAAVLPEGFRIVNPDPIEDIYDLSWLFWQGFDHGENKAEFEKEEIVTPNPRRHFNRDLCVAACDDKGELVSICGLWYDPQTDYAYVEPVCTIPSQRGKGVAKAVIHEALNRAKGLGAKRAFVISDMDFYSGLGFRNRHHYTFYQKQGERLKKT